MTYSNSFPAMSHSFVFCFKCRGQNFFSNSLSFRATCEKCGEDLHICKNCLFYDENSYNECRESSAEKVQDKERNNVCEYFKPLQKADKKTQNSREDLLKQAESLFKKK